MKTVPVPPHLPQDGQSPLTRYRFLLDRSFPGHRGALLNRLRFHRLHQPHLLQKVLLGVQPPLLFHQLAGLHESLDFHVTMMLRPEGTLPRHLQHLAAALAGCQRLPKLVAFVPPQPISSTALTSFPPRCT